MKKLILVTMLAVVISLVGCSQKTETAPPSVETVREEKEELTQTEVAETEVKERWEKTECLPEVQTVEVKTLEETKGTNTTQIPVIIGDYYLQVDNLVYNLMEEKTSEEVYEQVANLQPEEAYQVSEWNPSKLVPADDAVKINVTKYGEKYLDLWFTNNTESPKEAKELKTAYPVNFSPVAYSHGENREALKKRLQSCYISGGVSLDGEGLTYANIPEKLEKYGFKRSEANYTPNPGDYKLATGNQLYYEVNVALYDKVTEYKNANGEILKQQYDTLSIRFYIDEGTQNCYLVTIEESVVPLEIHPDATYTLK